MIPGDVAAADSRCSFAVLSGCCNEPLPSNGAMFSLSHHVAFRFRIEFVDTVTSGIAVSSNPNRPAYQLTSYKDISFCIGSTGSKGILTAFCSER